jgi:acylphosphatase
LITAIAMTRTLAAHGLPVSTKIIDFLPGYWAKGRNIDQITFAQLMTHTSGFRLTDNMGNPISDTFFPKMKEQVGTGVTSANLGVYSYQNMNFSICRILIPVMNGTIPANTTFPDNIWDFITISAYAADVEQHLFNPAGVSGPTFTHPGPDALGYEFPPGAGWDSGDLTSNSGGDGWHTSVEELLDVMGCFRRQGSIMSPAAAQTMLDNGFGIDLIESTPLGTLYYKWGLWATEAMQTEQCLAYFLPRDMELVVFANSPIGAAGMKFPDLVTRIYLNNIMTADIGVGRAADGRIEIFVQANDGHVWHLWQTTFTGDWSEWEDLSTYRPLPLGVSAVGEPGVGSAANGRIEIFVRGSDGHVRHLWQMAPNGDWSDWEDLSTYRHLPVGAVGKPGVGRAADGRIEIFVRCKGGHVWHLWQTTPNGDWSEWENLSGTYRPLPPGVSAIGEPGVGSAANGRIEIFVQGSDDHVWHLWQTTPNGDWSDWEDLGSLLRL